MRLTPRQQEVLELAAKGLAYKQIARKLGIVEQTVKNHMRSIYDRLCPLRRDLFIAIIEAWRHGEINLDL